MASGAEPPRLRLAEALSMGTIIWNVLRTFPFIHPFEMQPRRRGHAVPQLQRVSLGIKLEDGGQLRGYGSLRPEEEEERLGIPLNAFAKNLDSLTGDAMHLILMQEGRRRS